LNSPRNPPAHRQRLPKPNPKRPVYRAEPPQPEPKPSGSLQRRSADRTESFRLAPKTFFPTVGKFRLTSRSVRRPGRSCRVRQRGTQKGESDVSGSPFGRFGNEPDDFGRPRQRKRILKSPADLSTSRERIQKSPQTSQPHGSGFTTRRGHGYRAGRAGRRRRTLCSRARRVQQPRRELRARRIARRTVPRCPYESSSTGSRHAVSPSVRCVGCLHQHPEHMSKRFDHVPSRVFAPWHVSEPVSERSALLVLQGSRGTVFASELECGPVGCVLTVWRTSAKSWDDGTRLSDDERSGLLSAVPASEACANHRGLLPPPLANFFPAREASKFFPERETSNFLRPRAPSC